MAMPNHAVEAAEAEVPTTPMRRLRDRLSAQIYLFLGLLALLLSAGLVALSFVVYGEEMGPHILATIIGIFGEAALVVLVLDRMANSQKRREWRFVGAVVSHGVAACMVDLIRLCGTRWGSEAYSINSHRYDEFVQTLRLHLTNLQSNLEGLALGAESGVYDQARKIERRVAWMANYLNDKPAIAAKPWPWELEIILSMMKRAGAFMQAAADAEFKENLNKARNAMTGLGKVESPEKSDAAAITFWRLRMAHQNELLRLYPSLKPTMLRNTPSAGVGIWYDIDQTLAPFYFAIDFMLFDRINGGAVTVRW
jgi:hypothetical protein